MQGIEAEYHAKKDKVYCWRATRLVMSTRSPWLDIPSKDNNSDASLLDKVAANIKAEADAATAAQGANTKAAALEDASSNSPEEVPAVASPVASAEAMVE